MLAALVELADIGYMIATVITLVVMFTLRFTATDWLIYRTRRLVPACMSGMATSTAAFEDQRLHDLA
jgi:hypothetical protein